MRSLLLVPAALLTLLAACTSGSEEPASASQADMTEKPALDCATLGDYPDAAMKALGGTYARVGPAPANGLRSFTVGPLQDIAGWGGKNASYTRDMEAPCLDVVALGDGSGFTKASELPMTSASCTGQRGTITTLSDNPAIGAFLRFEDGSGLPGGTEIYFVTSSRLEPSGELSALCLANAATGERLLVTHEK